MKKDLINLFIKAQPFRDDLDGFLIDFLLESIDTKRFWLWDPKDEEWHLPERQEDIENVEDLFKDDQIWGLLDDYLHDFVYDLPHAFVYQWMITKDGRSQIDRLIDNQQAGRVFDHHFKNRFSDLKLSEFGGIYDLATHALKIYIFNEIVNLFEEHYDHFSKHFGEINWYESEAYNQTGDPPITCLADVGMSQKDFIE